MPMRGLADVFQHVHDKLRDRPFLFVLGAGASRPSEIPTAGELVHTWLPRVHARDPHATSVDFETWKTSRLPALFPGLDPGSLAASYSTVYDWLFRDDPDQGYGHLEDAMNGRIPSYGYVILARILAQTEHRVVITTNFDNLVADALSLCTDTFPIVCGHESLARFAKARPRRPLVVKVHRDLLHEPMSSPGELDRIAAPLREPLRRLLTQYTPIVAGYGGNDGTLMGLLDGLPERSIPGGIYWCYRIVDGPPRPEIRRFVARQRGRLVPIQGFDELMVTLGGALRITPPIDEMKSRWDSRAQGLRSQLDAITSRLNPASGTPHPVGAAATSAPGALPPAPAGAPAAPGPGTASEQDAAVADANAVAFEALKSSMQSSAQKTWWQWKFDADVAATPADRARVYEEGVRALPGDPDMLGSAATYYYTARIDPDRAETLFRTTIELAPRDATWLGNFALFLQHARKDPDRAEETYRRAIEADPRQANNLSNYAAFLSIVRKRQDLAEEHYRRAIQADPAHPGSLRNYAAFCSTIRGDQEQAEVLYRRAIAAAPTNASSLAGFAAFLSTMYKEHDRAEELYRRAIEADPADGGILGNYAAFCSTIRGDQDRAERLYRSAVDADPKDADNLGNFAVFLRNGRKDPDRAEELYRRAIDADPTHANNLGNFANFLTDVRQDHDRAEELYRRALEADPRHANHLGNYATFLKSVRKDPARAEVHYRRAVEVDAKHANNLGNLGGFLAATGRVSEGLAFVDRALASASDDESPLRLECRYYRLAHGPSERRADELREIRRLLVAGSVRSPGWDLSLNVARATADGHPDHAWLTKLAAVIADDADLSTLAGWPAWEAAGNEP